VNHGEKIEEYSHETFNLKNKRIVPLPKMGAKYEERYNTIASEYFEKKIEREKKHDISIKNLGKQS
jgi:hypothetical protein